MTQYASFEDLTGGVVETSDVTLPDGKVVKVRGLTRYELVLNAKSDDALEVERRMLSTCLVEPALSLGQVEAWQKAPGSASALTGIYSVIRELSGLAEGADKSSVEEIRD